ncbi:MAG TPA: hypothetical protein VL181_04980 [Holophagaceae bacterium]|jgi:hypothetical protein|nr:hypothetical protein [Holophagaceae bacterium]
MSPKTPPGPKHPIQPFVPAGPDDRTALYSRKELHALTRADPRNELDELSEPQRFKKSVDKPGSATTSKPGGA